MHGTLGDFHHRHGVAGKRAKVRDLLDGAEALLSPMAGVTDLVFRSICREHGADIAYCEFVSADGVLHGNAATIDLMLLGENEHPVGIQLFGGDPDTLAQAARTAQRLGPDLIDLNFGCPVKKVVKRNGGSALLCNVPLMEEIVRAAVAATELPVTAKIRLGWSRASLNFLEVTRMLEEAGACAVTVHGRTRDQRFEGHADWEAIAQIKAAATVPVVGNGDVRSGDDYLRMKRETGCDAVMIARAAIGNPWIFQEILAARRGEPYERPELDVVVETLLLHLDREIALHGPRVGMNRMKRHFSAYLKGYPNASSLRREVLSRNDRGVIEGLLRRYRDAHAGERAA